jgi:hypothetical protein
MTKAEQAYHDDLCRIIGCIACRIDGIINFHVSIHHCDGRTKKGCQMKVLPLCGAHHQTGGEEAPSIHPWKKRFEAKYGTQEKLMAYCEHLVSLARLAKTCRENGGFQ